MRLRRLATTCFVGACLLLLIGTWLLVDNQTVSISASDLGDDRPAGDVNCSIAPYDAGLNDNDDPPGGEHSREYSDEVASECYSVNMTRFKAAVGSGALGLVLLGAGILAAAGSARSSSYSSAPPGGG